MTGDITKCPRHERGRIVELRSYNTPHEGTQFCVSCLHEMWQAHLAACENTGRSYSPFAAITRIAPPEAPKPASQGTDPTN